MSISSSTHPTRQEQLAAMREFGNNTNARLPVLFLLDASSSMNGIIRGDNQHILRQEHSDGINWNIVTGDNIVTRMDELNVGLQRFVRDILADPLAKLAADVAVMTFARTVATVKEFGPIRESDSGLKISTSQENETLLGEAVELALDELDRRKRTYRAHGVEFYQPWLVVMTDGVPTSPAPGAGGTIEGTDGFPQAQRVCLRYRPCRSVGAFLHQPGTPAHACQ